MSLPLALVLAVSASAGDWTPLESVVRSGPAPVAKPLGWTEGGRHLVWRETSATGPVYVLLDTLAGKATELSGKAEFLAFKREHPLARGKAGAAANDTALVAEGLASAPKNGWAGSGSLELTSGGRAWGRWARDGEVAVAANWSPDGSRVALISSASGSDLRIDVMPVKPRVLVEVPTGLPLAFAEPLVAAAASMGTVRVERGGELGAATAIAHTPGAAGAAGAIADGMHGGAAVAEEDAIGAEVVVRLGRSAGLRLDQLCAFADEEEDEPPFVPVDLPAGVRAGAEPLFDAVFSWGSPEERPWSCAEVIAALPHRDRLVFTLEDDVDLDPVVEVLPWFLAQIEGTPRLEAHVTASGPGLPDLGWLDGLVSVTIAGEGVTDLSSLASLPALDTVDVAATSATDLGPLAALPDLTTLAPPRGASLTPLAGSAIRALRYDEHNGTADLAQITPMLPRLTSLEITGVEVADLALLSRAVGLEHLVLRHLPVRDVGALASLTHLTHLDLSLNEIVDISPLSTLVNVEHLDLRGNQVADLGPLASMAGLKWFDGTDNDFANLAPLAKLTHLEHLDLEYNAIADLRPVSGLARLYKLDLDGNKVRDLRPLAGLKALAKLDLDGNDVVDPSPLVGATALVELYMDGNPLADDWCRRLKGRDAWPDALKNWCFE